MCHYRSVVVPWTKKKNYKEKGWCQGMGMSRQNPFVGIKQKRCVA